MPGLKSHCFAAFTACSSSSASSDRVTVTSPTVPSLRIDGLHLDAAFHLPAHRVCRVLRLDLSNQLGGLHALVADLVNRVGTGLRLTRGGRHRQQDGTQSRR